MDAERVLVYEEAKGYGVSKIIRTEFQYDIENVRKQWTEIRKQLTLDMWYQKSQTCVQHSPHCINKWTEGCGSIKRVEGKRVEGKTEQDFHILNSLYKGTIFEDIIRDINAVRARIMVKPKHTCYSIHSDRTPRFHLPITTHKHALFVFYEGDKSTTLHIPADGYVWWTDTTRLHTFLNAGPERTHLVMCSSDA